MHTTRDAFSPCYRIHSLASYVSLASSLDNFQFFQLSVSREGERREDPRCFKEQTNDNDFASIEIHHHSIREREIYIYKIV